MIACNLLGLGVSQEVCWAVWIVYALLIAFLMWMRSTTAATGAFRDREPRLTRRSSSANVAP